MEIKKTKTLEMYNDYIKFENAEIRDVAI